ncbi:hypothetical protein NDU88_002453 [Pleurodeles waltl]|uniref:Uncharacterized protein n=1 Tax=Pleurodeles waltl TaxID=8319 RepID=A0AAV7P8B4_PLEWA|nr:hypothetical protein NDU88_002453 [Pleurodeles waltl]
MVLTVAEARRAGAYSQRSVSVAWKRCSWFVYDICSGAPAVTLREKKAQLSDPLTLMEKDLTFRNATMGEQFCFRGREPDFAGVEPGVRVTPAGCG